MLITQWLATFAAALWLIFPPALHAVSGGKDSDFLDLLDQENRVFAASRYVQTLSETPANVSIVSRTDIARFGYRTVAEALNALPGFYNSASQWPALGLRGAAVPGDFGSRVLFMVNGMPLYEPMYGGFFLEYLDIASIERIEVVRGSGSALYGNGAVSGIINLVTRTGLDAPGQKIQVEAGSHGTHSVYGSHAQTSANGLDIFASVSATGSKGRDIFLAEHNGTSRGNDAYGGTRFFGRISNQDFWAQAILVDGRKHDPLASFNSLFNTDRLLLRERFGAVEAGINHKLDSGALITGRVYASDVSERGDYPYKNDPPTTSDPVDYINVTDLMSRTLGAEARYDQYIGDHHLLAGLELKRVLGYAEVGNQPGATRVGTIELQENPSYSQYSLFMQDEWRWDDRRKLFFGARFDYYHSFSQGVKSHISPRIAYVQNFGGGHTGKLIWGEAFRAPTIYESLYTDSTASSSGTLWHNFGLKPEITRTLEALWEHEARKGVNLSLSAYLVSMRNTPKQVAVDLFEGRACDTAGACNQYQNSIGTNQVAGLEATGRWKHDDGFDAYASATWQHSSHQDGGEMTSSPRYLLKAGTSTRLPLANWRASAEFSVVDRTLGRINSDGTRTASTPTYALVHLGLSNKDIGDGWRASLRVNNLFDKTAYTVASRELQPLQRVPAPGRNLSLQIAKDF